MFNADNEFEKLKEQVKMEEEKFLNAEVTIENYKFPHIYLTEEEIEEFNKDCEKYGFDIKAVPLTIYMNLNSPDKSLNLDDEVDMEQKEKDIDRFMAHLGKNYHKIEEKEDKKENEFIGKKRNKKIVDDNSEEEGSNIGSFKSRSYMRKKIDNNNEYDMQSERSNLSEKNKNNIYEEEKNDKKINENKGKKKKLIKKKKPVNKSDEISDKFNTYFRKIKETRQKQIDDDNRKDSLINDILKQSELLTKEGLKALAVKYHIDLLNETTLSMNNLQKRDTNKLDAIMVDINFNSNIEKLNSGRVVNIKNMKEREEKMIKAKEEHLEHKRLREYKKQEQNKNPNNHNDNKSIENKKESDISDGDSDSDEDLI